MKNLLRCLLVLLTLLAKWVPASAQGTAFTYQGRLNVGGTPATGLYDLQFTLLDAASNGSQVGSSVTNLAVGVTNGLFTTSVDFGSVFNGEPLWLQIGVEPNGASGNFTLLGALQPLTSVPFAVLSTSSSSAGTANFANYAATAGSAATANNVPNGSVTSADIAAGQVVKSLNGLQDNVILAAGPNITLTPNGNTLTINSTGSGGTAGNAWSLAGNAGTSPANGNFLGTTDLEPLELWVDGMRALRLEPDPGGGYTGPYSSNVYPAGSPNLLGGYAGNAVAPTYYSGYAFFQQDYLVIGATIAGGGSAGAPNVVADDFSTIGGGDENSILAGTAPDQCSTIAGGLDNTIDSAYESAIAGGNGNSIATSSSLSFIGGGNYNQIEYQSLGAAVGGGQYNEVGPNGPGSFIGGGGNNSAGNLYTTIGGGEFNSSQAGWATVPGGYENEAWGEYSFAAGQQAQALHQGAFVWADAQPGPFASTAIDQFCIRAGGGMILDNSTSMVFGNQTRQMLTLYRDPTYTYVYGIGVQTSTLYMRTGINGGFAWYQGGTHNDAQNNPGTGKTMMTLDSAGNLRTTTGAIASLSDRNAKADFAPVNPQDVLARVSALPMTTWRYKTADASQRHIGPMAQDFYAAFNVGLDDKSICTVDEGGVALAAIQGLNQEVEAKDARIQEEAAEIATLQARLDKLEKLVTARLGDTP